MRFFVDFGLFLTLQQDTIVQRPSHAANKTITLDTTMTSKQLQAMTKFDTNWNMQFEQLVDFKRTNGHCRVPRGYEQDKTLGRWVDKQRIHHKSNKIRQDRKRLLDEIGFVWKDDGASNDKVWHQQHEKLLEFKRKNGHCMVPQRYERDKSLGIWVAKQRNLHVNNKIRQDRKRILDEIEFVWKADHDKLWHQQYKKLVEFKRKKGHCLVPQRYEQDKSLGQWVSHQRNHHVNNFIRRDRKILLDEIGFAWKADM
jgi:uncharacterized protein YbgA (DUF1722 family)